MREIRLLRSTWRGLETESRLGLLGHEWGNPGYGQGHDLTDRRASPRPYRASKPRSEINLPIGVSLWACSTDFRSISLVHECKLDQASSDRGTFAAKNGSNM